MSGQTLKNASKYSILVDELLTGAYHTLHRFHWHQLEVLGHFALLFIPVLDIAKAFLYRLKTQNQDYITRKGKNQARLTLLVHSAKAAMTTTGLAMILTGSALLGFGMIVAANAMLAVRSLYKAVQTVFAQNEPQKYQKTAKHLKNFTVSGLFTSAFALIFLFPPVAAPSMVAWGIVLAASVIAAAPRIWQKLRPYIYPEPLPPAKRFTLDCIDEPVLRPDSDLIEDLQKEDDSHYRKRVLKSMDQTWEHLEGHECAKKPVFHCWDYEAVTRQNKRMLRKSLPPIVQPNKAVSNRHDQ